MQGRHVMMGYLYNEAKTLEAFHDGGWLRSGDLGIAVSKRNILYSEHYLITKYNTHLMFRILKGMSP